MSTKFWGAIKNGIFDELDSKSVAFLGGFLTLTHVAFALHFWGQMQSGLPSAGRICWPFFSHCREIFHLDGWFFLIVVGLYLAATIFTASLFFRRIHLRWALGIFVGLWLVRYGFLLTDYRLMGNYHYMPMIISLAYVAFPRKLLSCTLFLIAFYFFAGTIKLNPQWMSGQALFDPVLFSSRLTAWGCAYVVLLEMFVVFFALHSKNVYRYGVLIQLALFHGISYIWVGYYYPTVMGLLLTTFWLYWKSGAKPFHINQVPSSTVVGLAVFALSNFLPYFVSSDPGVTTKGRMFSLNMFDAKTECYDYSVLNFKNKKIETSGTFDNFAIRIKCDPVLFLGESQRLCKLHQANPEFLGLDLHVKTRRTTSPNYMTLISIADYCKNPEPYKILGGNRWIL